MDIRFISSLIEVVNTGSIAAAARNQMLTPAAVSQRVKALEASLGCQLLSRAGHAAKPTSECLKVLPRLKHLVSEVDALHGDLDDTGLSGNLTIGAISTALSGILPSTIQSLAIAAPNLNLKIFPGTSANLYNLLAEKKVDVIVIVTPPFICPKNLKLTPLYSEQLGMLCNSNNQLSIKESLLAQSYIRYDRSAWGGAIADSYLIDNEIHVKSLCEIDSLETILLMVKQEMGVSLIPIWRGLEYVTESINILPISENKYLRHIALVSHRQIGKEPLIQAFSKTILKQV